MRQRARRGSRRRARALLLINTDTDTRFVLLLSAFDTVSKAGDQELVEMAEASWPQQTSGGGGAAMENPFAAMMGGAGGAGDPVAALFGNPQQGAGGGVGGGADPFSALFGGNTGGGAGDPLASLMGGAGGGAGQGGGGDFISDMMKQMLGGGSEAGGASAMQGLGGMGGMPGIGGGLPGMGGMGGMGGIPGMGGMGGMPGMEGEFGKQLEQVMTIGKILWRVGTLVWSFYARLRSIFPFLSLTLLRNLFMMRFLLKKLVLPKYGGENRGARPNIPRCKYSCIYAPQQETCSEAKTVKCRHVLRARLGDMGAFFPAGTAIDGRGQLWGCVCNGRVCSRQDFGGECDPTKDFSFFAIKLLKAYIRTPHGTPYSIRHTPYTIHLL